MAWESVIKMSNITLFEQPNPARTPVAIQFSAKAWHGKCISPQESLQLAQLVLSREGDLIKEHMDHTDDGGTGLGEFSLAAKFRAYNMFAWEDETCKHIKNVIKHCVKDMYPDYDEPLYGRMWGTILRRGQSIKPHHHNFDEYSFLSASIILQSETTSTYYQNPFGNNAISYKDEAGTLTLFPEYLTYWTDQHKNSVVPRIALGVDILTECALDDNHRQMLVGI